MGTGRTTILYFLFWQLLKPWWGFPGGSAVKNSPANAGDMGFDPWSRNIPWRREWQLTHVFLPRESHGQLCWLESMGSQRFGRDLTANHQQKQ